MSAVTICSDFGVQENKICHCFHCYFPHFTDEEKVETMTDFLFLGSKISVDDDCSHEMKRHLLLGRKAMTNLDSILRSRDTTLLTKIHLIKANGFSNSHVWM